MNQFKKEDECVIGIIGGEKSKKQTLASFLSDKKDDDIPTEINSDLIDSSQKPKYTLSPVFPNEEVQEIVMKEIDRLNKIEAYKRLGISIDSCNDISWERIIELEQKKAEQQKPKNKFLAKIRRRGV